VVTNPRERRLLRIEVLVVLTVTLGLSALRSALSLVDALLQPVPLAQQQVARNAPGAQILLVRGGIALRTVGLDGRRPGRDALGAAGLAALIGVPGLGLYFVARALGVSVAIAPSTLTETWWQLPVLIASAMANSWAEEVIIVAYLITQLRRLGWSENSSLFAQALLRGSYHLYQGLGGFIGNIVMGLVFGRVWQRTHRLWMLVGAHALIDIVAFAGYALLAGRVSWLP